MKKVLIIVGSIFALLIITLLAAPSIFKDDIIAMVEEEANNAVNAHVEFGDVDISIFSNFPDFSLELNDLVVTGIDSFADVKLADMGKLSLVVDINSVISGDEMVVKQLGLYDTHVHLKILKDGTANYDIAKEGEEDAAETDESEDASSEPLSIGLEDLIIEGFNFVYDDAPYDMIVEMEGLNMEGHGAIVGDEYTFKLESEMAGFTFGYEGINYLDSVHVTYAAEIIADLIGWKFTLGQNELAVNGIHTGIDGWVAMPTDDIDMDLAFHAKETDFKSLLTLVPAVYATDFEGIETTGKFEMSGFAKGLMTTTDLPAFDINLKVNDASFHYPDLPASVQDIQIAMDVSNPGGTEDATVIDMPKFHMDMAGNPVDVALFVRNPVTDPYVRTKVKTNLNLASIDQVMPLEEGENYEGIITSDLKLEGRVSALENEQYDKFHASGTVSLLDLLYQSDDLPYDVTVNNVQSTFHPENVTVENCELTLGKSDVRLIGKLDNLLSYYFGRQPLHGSFKMSSQLMDLNELMDFPEDSIASEVAEETAEEDSISAELAAIPDDIEFDLMASIDKMLYDQLVMEQVIGRILIKDSRASLDHVKTNMLGGSAILTGYFDTKVAKEPVMDMDMELKNIQIPLAYKAFNTVQKLAPIAETAQGGVSTKLHMNTKLDNNFDPIYNSLTGGGALTTHNVVMKNADGLQKLAEVLNMNKFKQIEMNDIDIGYLFENGRINVDPFDLKMGDIKATIVGSNGFDQSMDYNIAMDIPSSELGGGMAAGFMNALSGGASGDRVNVDVGVLGTVIDPQFKPKFKGFSGQGSVKDQAKDALKENVDQAKAKAQAEADKLKKEAEEKLNAEKERLKKEAEAKKKAAEAEAAKAKKEAEAKAKAEADKLKNEAKDKVKGLFK